VPELSGYTLTIASSIAFCLESIPFDLASRQVQGTSKTSMALEESNGYVEH
jgi:hypothetical protein